MNKAKKEKGTPAKSKTGLSGYKKAFNEGLDFSTIRILNRKTGKYIKADLLLNELVISTDQMIRLREVTMNFANSLNAPFLLWDDKKGWVEDPKLTEKGAKK